MDTRICTHREMYTQNMKRLADQIVLEIIDMDAYRNSKRSDYRFWWRLAVREAAERGLR